MAENKLDMTDMINQMNELSQTSEEEPTENSTEQGTGEGTEQSSNGEESTETSTEETPAQGENTTQEGGEKVSKTDQPKGTDYTELLEFFDATLKASAVNNQELKKSQAKIKELEEKLNGLQSEHTELQKSLKQGELKKSIQEAVSEIQKSSTEAPAQGEENSQGEAETEPSQADQFFSQEETPAQEDKSVTAQDGSTQTGEQVSKALEATTEAQPVAPSNEHPQNSDGTPQAQETPEERDFQFTLADLEALDRYYMRNGQSLTSAEAHAFRYGMRRVRRGEPTQADVDYFRQILAK